MWRGSRICGFIQARKTVVTHEFFLKPIVFQMKQNEATSLIYIGGTLIVRKKFRKKLKLKNCYQQKDANSQKNGGLKCKHAQDIFVSTYLQRKLTTRYSDFV